MFIGRLYPGSHQWVTSLTVRVCLEASKEGEKKTVVITLGLQLLRQIRQQPQDPGNSCLKEILFQCLCVKVGVEGTGEDGNAGVISAWRFLCRFNCYLHFKHCLLSCMEEINS